MEYAAQNFKNPLESVKDGASARIGGPPPQQPSNGTRNILSLISAKTHSMAVLDLIMNEDAYLGKSKLDGKSKTTKNRQKRIHHS